MGSMYIGQKRWSYSMDLQLKKIVGAETGVGFEPRGRVEIDVKYMKM